MVLIESDWNLKFTMLKAFVKVVSVLIESDWNLKKKEVYEILIDRYSINRIRLEFKGELEGIKMALKRVLIESDWNLKNRVQFTDFL